MTTKTKKSNKTATDVRQVRRKSAAKMQPIRNGSATDSPQIRYAFVPLLQRFRNEHTNKNKETQARTWIPVECSLLIRYEFASLSPQTRYAFVAILLYCGMRGIELIPLDSKFLSSALIIDERTLRKSLDELLENKLLLERKKDREEKTDRQTDENGVSVNSENLSQNGSENKEEKEADKKDSPVSLNGNSKHSQFSIEECLKYVEAEITKGVKIENPKALARNLFQSGEADSFIRAALYPEQQKEVDLQVYGEPRRFTLDPCAVCFGAKMADADGKGFGACSHCKNEKGKSTGLEPEGVKSDEAIY